MASIHTRTRKDGSIAHRVAFRIEGRQAQESFDDPVAAVRFQELCERVGGRAAREWLLDQESGDEEVPTLAELVEQYLDPESGLLGGIGADTRKTYGEMAKRSFLPRLGELPVTAVSEVSVQSWVNWQASQPTYRSPNRTVAAKTVKNYHALLSGVLASAVRSGIIASNPAYGIRLPAGRRAPIVFLTEKEFGGIYKMIPEFYQPATLALAGTGLRFGELSALTWADLVEVDSGWCFDINKSWKGAGKNAWVGQPKTENGVRLVSVSDEIVQRLGARGASHTLIFRSASGLPLTSGTLAKLGLHHGVREFGLQRRPRVHDLRHSHASWLIAQNVPLPYIQRRLGHENIDTTIRIYGHLLPEALSATRDAATMSLKFALAA